MDEAVIGGVLHRRAAVTEDWRALTAEQLTAMVLELRAQASLERLIAAPAPRERAHPIGTPPAAQPWPCWPPAFDVICGDC